MKNKLINILFITLFCFSCSPKKLNCSEIFELYKDEVFVFKACNGDSDKVYGTATSTNKKNYYFTCAHLLSYISQGSSKLYSNFKILDALNNEKELEIVQYNETQDIALLKSISTNDSFIEKQSFYQESEIKTGEKIFCIGNSINKGIGISEGNIHKNFVSIKYGDETRVSIQCNVNVYDGNSGGALVNEFGNLIGITSYKIKDENNEIIEDMCYAIPISKYMECFKNYLI